MQSSQSLMDQESENGQTPETESIVSGYLSALRELVTPEDSSDTRTTLSVGVTLGQHVLGALFWVGLIWALSYLTAQLQ